MKICVYPGSFDPITNGHLDIIERASKLCDKLIVAVGVNSSKNSAFTKEERIELIKCALGERKDIDVISFKGMLVDFMKENKANVIVKGLRTVSDFEYELHMALFNRIQDPDIETLFMMPDLKFSFLSSSGIKEIAKNGGKIDGLVPDCIKEAVLKKFNKAGEED